MSQIDKSVRRLAGAAWIDAHYDNGPRLRGPFFPSRPVAVYISFRLGKLLYGSMLVRPSKIMTAGAVSSIRLPFVLEDRERALG